MTLGIPFYSTSAIQTMIYIESFLGVRQQLKQNASHLNTESSCLRTTSITPPPPAPAHNHRTPSTHKKLKRLSPLT